MIDIEMNYSVAIRTLGQAGDKYQTLLNSLLTQTIQPQDIYVYIAEGYPLPKETVRIEKYVYVKKGMVSQRALRYDEIDSEYILFLDDDVFLPADGVEKLYSALVRSEAQVVAPDVFANAERTYSSKVLMAVSGRMWPRKDDRKWAYKVMRNSGYSYNDAPSQDIYLSQTNAGPCFLCSKKDFLNINYHEELWLERCKYALGDDQVMFYKMWCKGYKQLTLFNSGIIHLDAGTTLRSEDKEKSMIYSDIHFKLIFWHRFIYTPEKNIILKLWSIMSVSYTMIFTLLISLLKGNVGIYKIKTSAIKAAIHFIKDKEYKELPNVSK